MTKSTWFSELNEATLSTASRFAFVKRFPYGIAIPACLHLHNGYVVLKGRISVTVDGVVTTLLKTDDVLGEWTDAMKKRSNLVFRVESQDCELLEVTRDVIRLLDKTSGDTIMRLRLMSDRFIVKSITGSRTNLSTSFTALSKNNLMRQRTQSNEPTIVIQEPSLFDIPNTCIDLIIACLPLKDSLNCRLVCKQWASVILGKIKIPKLHFTKESFNVRRFQFIVQNLGGTVREFSFNGSGLPLNVTHIRLMVNHCWGLTRLNLRYCEMVAHSPEALSLIFGRCVNLVELVLPRMMLVGKSWPQSRIKSLQSLQMYRMRNLAESHLTSIIRDNPELKHLTISHCVKIDDQCVHRIGSELKQLRVLRLSGLLITDISMKHIAKGLPNLRQLDISLCTLLTDLGMQELASGGHRFEFLDVSGNVNLTDASIVFFANNLQHLKVLKMVQCYRITPNLIRYLPMICPRLQKISVGGCRSIRQSHTNSVFPSNCQVLVDQGVDQVSMISRAKLIDLSARYHLPTPVMKEAKVVSLPASEIE
jgi:hypothetical protein